MGAANSAPPKPAGMVGTPGTNSPASNGARPTSATPGPSATPEGSREVELLDPKLVNVILSFKKSILPTLAEKLDPLLGESLIMSAVDRLLGFTDDTFVQSKSEQQKQHFAEAEKALMKHLETRFGEYVRNRSAQR
ncbi:hypothetical protein M406DRAFT_358446 [Cryphonectria parasitica EP155]|uniref:Uncharacterized protein n=1 Tax=Cryphonectria parasitica (strain ATCC 38755 / EP155) TaxID=660469 RepID=A0A9P4XUF2_CRYP1|nr:uncharacterized protein M406DRAFT_358446 [Cryphonectria parasitica EP155]KAF3761021.1 hypothetical protein M406DRAFT_358446 [Cryphonectria parasitica EP155]